MVTSENSEELWDAYRDVVAMLVDNAIENGRATDSTVWIRFDPLKFVDADEDGVYNYGDLALVRAGSAFAILCDFLDRMVEERDPLDEYTMPYVEAIKRGRLSKFPDIADTVIEALAREKEGTLYPWANDAVRPIYKRYVQSFFTQLASSNYWVPEHPTIIGNRFPSLNRDLTTPITFFRTLANPSIAMAGITTANRRASVARSDLSVAAATVLRSSTDRNGMTDASTYPIGNPGSPWGEIERDRWRARQPQQRRYDIDVVPRIDALTDRYERVAYGQLDYAGETYPLLALRDRVFDPALPTALVTGGVHGYETSGVLGVLDFLETRAADYVGRVNLLAVPCVSPWAYERIHRWNYDAIDPNRNFRADGPAREATALIELVHSVNTAFLLHIDLHETTDSDESEFRPALAARDGKDYEPGEIPDGFYLVDDSANPQPAFQQAIIAAVEQVTHIAPADAQGEIIGSPVVAHGVIEYPLAELGLCPSITGARYTTTTEVYPDSPRTNPAECVRAQVAAVCAALDYALAHQFP